MKYCGFLLRRKMGVFSVYKPHISILHKLFLQIIWEVQKKFLSLHLTQLVRSSAYIAVCQSKKGKRVMTFWKRTFTNVIFRVSNLANLNPSLKNRNRNVHVGCIVSCYNISWRGLTRVAYLRDGGNARA